MGVQVTRVLALAVLMVGVFASSGSAATPARLPILGVVPHANAVPALAAPQASSTTSPLAGRSFLTFDANYETLINRYFADVAHDSGTATNVYSAAEQYSDGSGAIQYQSTFGGSYVASDPLPASGCDDGIDAVCLTDAQLQGEIQNVLTAKGWHGSNTTMFFLMTPDGLGSCFDSFDTNCTTNTYCAYHNAFTDSSGEPVIYANEPYDATITDCWDGTSPNGDDADATLNTISHEHNEAITDPFGDAWYAADGNENGDLCAWGFGDPLSPGGTYNQVINGDHYWLQQEYSNADKGCVQYLGGHQSQPTPPGKGPLVDHGGPVMHTNTTYAIYWLPTPGIASLPIVTGAPGIDQPLTTSNGTWTASPSSYSFQWERCSSTGTDCANIAGATTAKYKLASADVGHTVRSTVRATNVNGPSSPASSAITPVVVPLPAATARPFVSGIAGVGRALSTTAGVWNSSVSIEYQWLRCAASGTGCVSIPGATAATHVLTAADAGHALQVRVTATNAAGMTAALSNLSGVVIAAPALRKKPHVRGRARVGNKLSGGPGTWANSPNAYRYQWLRCNAHGRSCTRIGHATRSSYRLSKRDAGHRIRLRVTAVNVSGDRAATSSATARVPAQH